MKSCFFIPVYNQIDEFPTVLAELREKPLACDTILIVNNGSDDGSEKLIRETALSFVGKISQKPPLFSAVKKEGKRLYEYARKGKEVVITPREVEIFTFEITKIDMPEVHFRVVCSKGTYIRSLANDFGMALKSGGHLSALRRTKIGDYHVNNGISPVEFRENLQIKGLNS